MLATRSLRRAAMLLSWVALTPVSLGSQSSPQLFNTGLAGADWGGSPSGPGGAVLPVSEAGQAGVDLNLDGDSLDAVPFLFLPTGVAPTTVGVSSSDSVDPLLFHRRIAFLVRESDEGGVDLNGDGDTSDRVLHVFERSTQQVKNLGVALAAPYGSARVGDNVFVAVRESSQAQTDLNGDGDTGDRVVHQLVVP